MRSLEGANCAGLPPFVIDKYFDCDVGRQPMQAKVGFAICSNCVVQIECRDEAVAMERLPRRGIIGGVSAREIREARAWIRYEHGLTDRVPDRSRPQWLGMSEAAQIVERTRLEADLDEPQPLP